MQKNYAARRELKRQLYTRSRLKIKTFRSRRSTNVVRNVPMNGDFPFSVDDKLN